MRIGRKRAGEFTRVFLVDPFAIIRRTVCGWLERTADLVVCGQAQDAASALEEIARLKPDIVVTEILDQKDLRFIQSLHKRHPRLPILVYSFGNEMQYAPKALEAGADGFLFKAVRSEGLVDAIRRTLEGRVVLSPSVRYQLLAKCMRRGRKRVPPRRNHTAFRREGPRRAAARD